MKKHFLIGTFFLLINFVAFGQNELFLKKTFVYKSDTLLYRVLFPEKYDATKTYPLVIFLHGAGERGNDNTKQLVHGASLFTNPENRTKFPAIVIFPQCPADKRWVNYDKKSKDEILFPDPRKNSEPLELVYRLIKYYRKNESVDKNRIYLVGLSMGGIGTYDLICRYPKLFAAAIPICGAVDVKRLNKVRNMPIRIYHGSNDDVISPEFSRNAYIELKADGSQKAEYIEIPGANHNSWDPAFEKPDFLTWLFSKRK